MSDPTPSEPQCIFCKIAAGSIPCHTLLDDERVLAFLDNGPLAPGHALVIPRAHHVTIDTMPDDLAAACAAMIPRLSRAIMAATGTSAWNVLQNNGKRAHQAVNHVHFHIIPRTAEQGLGITWPAGRLEDADARSLADQIRQKL
jgi:histidine triad (HIT) family protein